MRTFLAIIFIISATVKAGECLVCIECKNSTNPDCAGNEVTCGTCMTTVAEIDPRNGSSKSLSVEKTCNLNPEICNITYSISGSKSRVRYTVKCCNTDLCNKEAPEVSPWNVTSTGLQCPACYEPNAETCVANTPVQCTGDENRCLVFSGKFPQSGKCETIAFQGCASELVCNNFGYLYPDNALCPGADWEFKMALEKTIKVAPFYGRSQNKWVWSDNVDGVITDKLLVDGITGKDVLVLH